MQRVLSFFSIVFLTVSMMVVSFDADARRFGGGRSFGKAPSHQSRQATPSRPANQPNNPQAAPGRSWMGPLAGFVAGGLLASLFMGGGFSGINFFDIIIVVLLAFFVIRFIKSRARPQQATNNTINAFQDKPNQQSIFGTQKVVGSSAPIINVPIWFNETAFLSAAREHFMSLQEHWDANEMDKIAEYVTPEILAFLKQERADDGNGYQSTYIDDLNVVLDGLDDTAEKTIATLTFTGVAKTSRFDQGEAFNESWRMEREQGENKPWLVAGIRQNM